MPESALRLFPVSLQTCPLVSDVVIVPQSLILAVVED